MLSRDNTIQSLKDNKIEEHYGIKFQERPFIKKINLRIDSNNKNLISSTHKVLNAILPASPNTYTINEKIKILWLSPNEWLIVNEKQNDENDLLTKLHKTIGSKEASVTDVSENRTIIRISGDKLLTLLAKFLVLDLNNNLSKQLSVVQTLFVKVPVLIIRINQDNQTQMLDIFTNRSHANYIYNLLIDGSKNLDF